MIVVWPLFHYIVPQDFSPHEGSALQERSWWRDYLEFNNAFADAIMKVYKPGDIVWIHDYHLLMLPEILRQRAGKDIYIGLFMHAPWPSSEIFKVLSRRKALLSGMLAANMLAFQSDTYKNHFTSCCKRLLGYTESYDARGNVTGVDTHGAHCAVEALPIGIDVEKLLISAKMEIIKNAYIGRQIIVGRDRLDSVRGVVQKLRAFERFLDLYPEFIGKVCNGFFSSSFPTGFSTSFFPVFIFFLLSMSLPPQ
jgi:trehalose 6-phosphate synthase/phosphatase